MSGSNDAPGKKRPSSRSNSAELINARKSRTGSLVEIVKRKSGRRTHKTIRVDQHKVNDFITSVKPRKSSHAQKKSQAHLEESPYLKPWEMDELQGKRRSTVAKPKQSTRKSIFGHRIMTKVSPANSSIEPTEKSEVRVYPSLKSVSWIKGGNNKTPAELLNEVRKSLEKISTSPRTSEGHVEMVPVTRLESPISPPAPSEEELSPPPAPDPVVTPDPPRHTSSGNIGSPVTTGSSGWTVLYGLAGTVAVVSAALLYAAYAPVTPAAPVFVGSNYCTRFGPTV